MQFDDLDVVAKEEPFFVRGGIQQVLPRLPRSG